MDWSKKFEELESVALRLEPEGAIRRSLNEQAFSYAEEFLQGIGDCKTFFRDQGHSEALDVDLAENPADFDDLLQNLLYAVDSNQINPASGGHLGYIPGGGIYPSAIGDFLADLHGNKTTRIDSRCHL